MQQFMLVGALNTDWYVTRYAKSMKKNVRYIRKRSFKNFDEKGFKDEVGELKWFDVYISNDVNFPVL